MSEDDPAAARAALAAEAERLKRERAEAQNAEKSAAAKRERAQAREDQRFSAARMRRSVSRPWVFWSAVTLLIAGAMLGYADGEDRPAGAPRTFEPLAGLPLGAAFVLFAAHFTANGRYRRWSAALPFKLLGVEEVLGAGRAVTDAALDIAFRDTRAPREVVAELLRARVPLKTNVADGKTFCLLSERIGREGANYPLVGWLRRVTGRVLVDIHRAYPIESVTLRVVKDDEFYVPSGD